MTRTESAQAAEAGSAAPVAPFVPLPVWTQVRALRRYHTVGQVIRAAGAPSVAMLRLGPPKLTGGRWVVLTSPEAAHDLLTTFPAVDKDLLVDAETRAWGNNVFSMANADWLPRRKLLQPVFTKPRVATYAGHMARAAETMAAGWQPGSAVDLDAQMRQLTLRVIGRSVFGFDLGERATELGPHIRIMLRWAANRAARPLRVPAWAPTPARHRFHRALATVQATVDAAIAEARSDPSRPAELIRQLLAARDDDGRPLSGEAIRDELIIFVIAGHDTTSTTLSYALWALGRRPDVQSRVAAEARAVGPRELTAEDIPALPYTVQVIHEALRLCPPAASFARSTAQDVVVDGHLIPKNCNVIVNAYYIHRDPQLWNEPETFDPNRFTAERMKTMNRWQFIPFGGGPRSCIGEHFAMLEAALAVATIVRAVEIDSLNDTFPLALPFTMTAAGPIPARASLRP